MRTTREPIFIPIAQIEPVGTSVVSTLIILFGGGYLLYLRMEEPEKLKWKLDDEFSKRWLKRVKNQLHESGYVFTDDFNNLYVDDDEVNCAIENYFNRYEFEQSLVLTKRAVRGLLETSYFLELRYDHLPTRLRDKEES